MGSYNFTAKEILQKDFNNKLRGYDPVEVDQFLDGVIKDYESYNREIANLNEENQRLIARVDQLTKSQATLSRIKQDSPIPKAVPTATNFDILKRISNLEKEVFGSKLEDTSHSLGETRKF